MSPAVNIVAMKLLDNVASRFTTFQSEGREEGKRSARVALPDRSLIILLKNNFPPHRGGHNVSFGESSFHGRLLPASSHRKPGIIPTLETCRALKKNSILTRNLLVLG